jgi:zinc D-Ala-D-Ala carboxypeptidase
MPGMDGTQHPFTSAPVSDLRLTPNFWLSEFTRSRTAVRLGVANYPGERELANLRRLAQVLETIRTLLGRSPISISSGYREPRVNRAVGGSANSLHMLGCAADFTAPSAGSPLTVCRAIAANPPPLMAELIYEGTWVHLGIAPEGSLPPVAPHVLTAVFRPGEPTRYVPGIQNV